MICFTWWGLTQYAARAIEAFNKASKEPVIVVATRPQSSPVQGMEKNLTCPIIWVKENDVDVMSKLPDVPRVVFISNWNLPCFRQVENAVRKNGGIKVAMLDTDFRLNFREFLRAIRFRLFIRKRFDKFFVVGESGRRLMRFYGVRANLIFKGMYGADASLFCDGEPLEKRTKRIIYVGQFIPRKNTLRFVKAFAAAKLEGWTLDLYGAGVLKDELKSLADNLNIKLEFLSTRINIHDFVQPEQLAALYRDARAFVLPSLEEHWGVVVHEAALSGCFLLLSEAIGAGKDFAVQENSAVFDPLCEEEMVEGIRKIGGAQKEELVRCHDKSIELARHFGLGKFVESVEQIVGVC